jgi:hypothetical protein
MRFFFQSYAALLPLFAILIYIAKERRLKPAATVWLQFALSMIALRVCFAKFKFVSDEFRHNESALPMIEIRSAVF